MFRNALYAHAKTQQTKEILRILIHKNKNKFEESIGQIDWDKELINDKSINESMSFFTSL